VKRYWHGPARGPARALGQRPGQRLAALIALVAMAMLVVAVPVHHVHMLHMGLGKGFPGGASTGPAATGLASAGESGGHLHHPSDSQGPESGHQAHSHAAHHIAHHAAHEPALPEPGPAGAGAGGEEGHGQDMPRCPICSTVQAAGLPVPGWVPALVAAPVRSVAQPLAAAAALPAFFHFRPVQPRAPPIAG